MMKTTKKFNETKTVNLSVTTKKMKSLFVVVLFFLTVNISAQSNGSVGGTANDTFVINNDNSNRKAVLRLQNSTTAAWIIENDSYYNLLGFKYAGNSNHNDYGDFLADLNSSGRFYARGGFLSKGHFSLQPGTGYGIRFWNSDSYKIHMGNNNKYKYGPVTDYSIKMNMNDDSRRGWTWGKIGQEPIAALNTEGKMQIKNWLKAGNTIVGSVGSYALFGHNGLNQSGYNNYALLQSSDGTTFINASNGKTIKNRINNVDKLNINVSEVKVNTVFRATYPGAFVVPFGATAKPHFLAGTTALGQDKYVKGSTLTVSGRINIVEKDKDPRQFNNLNDTKYKDFLLWVEEGIVAKDMAIAEVTSWPDYVFSKDYKLTSIEDVEKNITEKGHLHTMPSAEAIEKEGFTVHDMTKRTVRTIEELTLHTIAQEKKIKKQKLLIENLIQRLEKIEKQLLE